MLQSFDLFGELAYNEIHYMDGNSEQKALYHAVVGGIMSKLTGGDFLAGATAAGINKLVIEEVKKAANYEPDKMQWVSAVLGAVVAEFVSSNAQAGGSVASSATKNNDVLLKPDELAELLFDDKRSKYFCDNLGIENNEKNITILKDSFEKFVKESTDVDAVMFNIGVVNSENSLIVDTETMEWYRGIGGVYGKSKGVLGLSIVGIKIITSDSTIDLKDPATRKSILEGSSISGTAFAGAGGGLSYPVASEYFGRVILLVKGIGTPQIGVDGAISLEVENRLDPSYIHNNAMDNKYGSD